MAGIWGSSEKPHRMALAARKRRRVGSCGRSCGAFIWRLRGGGDLAVGGAGGPHRFGGLRNRGRDAHMGAAAAQVGLHVRADFRLGGRAVAVQQRHWARITMPAMQ